jgi:hypothetical protein
MQDKLQLIFDYARQYNSQASTQDPTNPTNISIPPAFQSSTHFELSQGGINSDDSAQEESHLEQELAELPL